MSAIIQIPCITKHFFPETAECLIALAKKHLTDIQVFENFTCCGLPFFENGDLITAKKTGELNLKNIENQSLISCSEKCSQVFTIQYPKIFNNTFSHNQAQNLAKKTTSLLNFLLQISTSKISLSDLGQNGNNKTNYFVIFDCSSDKHQQIKILEKIGLNHWHTPTIVNTCCGAGSCLPIYAPEMAEKLSQNTIEEVLKLECSTIICFDDICRHQLNLAIKKSNHNISTVHIIDLFHKASL